MKWSDIRRGGGWGGVYGFGFVDLRDSTLKFDNKHLLHPYRLDDGTNDIPLLHDNKVLENSVYAIVWSAVSTKCDANLLTKYHLKTSLCYQVQMENFKQLIEVSSFEAKCFAFTNTAGARENYDNTAIVFHDHDDWSQIFLDGCHSRS